MWKDEFAKWLGSTKRVVKLDGTSINMRDLDVAICPTSCAHNYIVRDGAFKEGDFRCAIMDEAHELKTESSQRSLAIVPVLRAANRVILLSGTPAFADPMELWPQLYGIGIWFERKEDFIRTFCNVDMSKTRQHMLLNTIMRGSLML